MMPLVFLKVTETIKVGPLEYLTPVVVKMSAEPCFWCPIGAIDGYDGNDQNSLEMMCRDLGLEGGPKFVTIPVADKPGQMAVLVTPAIFVDSYEEAEALTGFVPFMKFSGYHAVSGS
jgi:hypothetical protein